MIPDKREAKFGSPGGGAGNGESRSGAEEGRPKEGWQQEGQQEEGEQPTALGRRSEEREEGGEAKEDRRPQDSRSEILQSHCVQEKTSGAGNFDRKRNGREAA